MKWNTKINRIISKSRSRNAFYRHFINAYKFELLNPDDFLFNIYTSMEVKIETLPNPRDPTKNETHTSYFGPMHEKKTPQQLLDISLQYSLKAFTQQQSITLHIAHSSTGANLAMKQHVENNYWYITLIYSPTGDLQITSMSTDGTPNTRQKSFLYYSSQSNRYSA